MPGSNLLGVDPQLGPLGDNGGPTQTMAIAATSPAVNKGGGGLTTRPAWAAPPRRLPGRAVLRRRGRQRRRIGAFDLQVLLPVVPSNRFRFGKVKLNKRKGTATVAVVVPGAGDVRLVGSKKVRKASKTAKSAGTVKLLAQGKGQGAALAQEQRRVKVKAKFTFAPTGGRRHRRRRS